LFVWATKKDEEVYTLIQGRLSPLHITNPVAFIITLIIIGMFLTAGRDDADCIIYGQGSEECQQYLEHKNKQIEGE